MLESPFNPGAGTTPPVLAGREALLADAEALLTGAVHFGRAVSPLVWTGVRGVGKTAALLDVRRRAEESGFVVAHVTADPKDMFRSLVSEAALEIAEAGRGVADHAR